MAKQDKRKLHPIQDIITRWNSLFLMLERFLVIFSDIKEVINSQSNDYDSAKDLINSYKKNELKLLEVVVEILRPFFKVTEILSGQKYTTSSLIIHSIFYLKKKLSTKLNCEISTKLQKVLLASLEFYLDKYEILLNPFLCCALFLNPEYRNLSHSESEYEKKKIKEIAIDFVKGFSYSNQNCYQKTNVSIQKSTSSDSVDSFYGDKCSENQATSSTLNSNLNEQTEIELIKYTNCIVEPNTKCLTFWYTQEKNFPLLQQVARVVLTATATSVPSEMIFSAGSNQVWERRNRLSASSVEKIMFLLNNLENEVAQFNQSISQTVTDI